MMASGARASHARAEEERRRERARSRVESDRPSSRGGRPSSAARSRPTTREGERPRTGGGSTRAANSPRGEHVSFAGPSSSSASGAGAVAVPALAVGDGAAGGGSRPQTADKASDTARSHKSDKHFGISDSPRHAMQIVHDNVNDPLAKPKSAEEAAKANMLARKDSTWQRDLQAFLDDPSVSHAAMGFAVSMVVLILASAFILVFHKADCKGAILGDWLGYFEVIACCIFSLEIVARFLVSQSIIKAIQDPYLIFDILAVLPCWLMPLRSCGQFLKMLKTLRMFRLLKLARRYEGSVVIVRAMKLSMPALTVAFFFLFTALTVFATFLYFTERLNKEDAGAFRSIPHTMWFMAVTMTTVGYGDVTPLTDGGRIVTVMAMLFGVLFISMPLAIVGNNFCLVWDDKERVIFVEKLKEQLALRGMGPSDMLATVEAMDADGSGMLSFREFLAALNLLEIKMSANRLAVLWRTLDTDHSGDVSLINFMEVIHRDDPAQLEILRNQFPQLTAPPIDDDPTDDDGAGDGAPEPNAAAAKGADDAAAKASRAPESALLLMPTCPAEILAAISPARLTSPE